MKPGAMKPVPFAQYLAQKQLGAAGSGSSEGVASPSAPPASWPPRQAGGGGETPRVSPLLRRLEAARGAANPAGAVKSAGAAKAGDAAEFRSLAEQKKAKAVEEARAAARQELEQEFAAERARLIAEAEAERANERARWVAEEGARLAEAHRAAFEGFTQSCAQTVAAILRPFLVQREILRVTEALIENLENLFSARGAALFEIAGPPDLLAALESHFSAQKAQIRFIPADVIDVRATADDTILETQLGPWLEALGAASGGGVDG